MKKLLIAMTAAAVGTCAWATEGAGGEGTEPTTPATPAMLNETFGDNWTLNAPWSYWSGAESATPAEGELTAGDALSLNTGSKVLRGNFMSDGSAKDIDTGLYFKSTVTFKDPSDTLPTLGEADKFALVVLDNVESIEEGYTATPATNLWVIAKYGESEQRAYQLDVEVDPTWLATDHKIVVKAYENVMASGNCAGFLVKVDNEENDTVCTVVQSCAIVDGVIDYGTSCAYDMWLDGADKNLGYLGYPKAAILGAVQKRYTDATLILSNVPGSDKLTSVDFQGQGVIDNVELATTGAGFGTDSLALTVVANGVTLVDTDTTLYFAEVGDTVTIKFKLNKDCVLKTPDGLTPDANGVYTYVYTTTENNEEVEIYAFKPAAIVGGTAYPTFAKALEAAVTAGGTIQLADAITLESEPIQIESDVTIDLAGKTIEVAGDFPAIYNAASTLTIEDSVGGGKVKGAVTGGGTFVITGGGFLASANTADNAFTLAESVANGYQVSNEPVDGYWVVTEKQIVNYTVAASFNADQVTVTGLTTGTVAENTVLSFTVAAKNGFENVVVKAGETELNGTNGAYTWTVVANVTITITADAVVVGPSIDDEEGKIVVDEQTGNATIDTTNATVTVTGTVTGDVIVTPSVGTVNVTLAEGKTVKIYSGNTDISGAFTVSSANGTTTIVLNENGSVNGVSVKPEMAAAGDGDEEMKAPLEVGTDVAVGVKTIPGLMYQLIRSDAPNGTFGGVGDAVKGTGAPVKLSDSNKPAGKAFYKVKVSAR